VKAQVTDPLLECLLVACEQAVRVDCMPLRQDGSFAASYASSGDTLARRIRNGEFDALLSRATAPAIEQDAPAPYQWSVRLRAGGVRRTVYRLWLQASPEQLEAQLAARKEAARVRAALPHEQRRRKPWGPL
jgi:hypothetical protein